VKAAFDEWRLFKKLHHYRNDSAMSHHWHIIQHTCNKWHDVVEEVCRVHVSGTNFVDQVRKLVFIVHCWSFFRPFV
jgi:hypothetical protein